MRVYIENIQQAKRELAKVYRDYKTKIINGEDAKVKVHILRAIIEASYKYDVEIRLEDLESKMNTGNLS